MCGVALFLPLVHFIPVSTKTSLPKTRQVAFRLSEALLREIDREVRRARKTGKLAARVSRTAVVEYVLRAGLEALNGQVSE